MASDNRPATRSRREMDGAPELEVVAKKAKFESYGLFGDSLISSKKLAKIIADHLLLGYVPTGKLFYICIPAADCDNTRQNISANPAVFNFDVRLAMYRCGRLHPDSTQNINEFSAKRPLNVFMAMDHLYKPLVRSQLYNDERKISNMLHDGSLLKLGNDAGVGPLDGIQSLAQYIFDPHRKQLGIGEIDSAIDRIRAAVVHEKMDFAFSTQDLLSRINCAIADKVESTGTSYQFIRDADHLAQVIMDVNHHFKLPVDGIITSNYDTGSTNLHLFSPAESASFTATENITLETVHTPTCSFTPEIIPYLFTLAPDDSCFRESSTHSYIRWVSYANAIHNTKFDLLRTCMRMKCDKNLSFIWTHSNVRPFDLSVLHKLKPEDFIKKRLCELKIVP